MTAFNSTLTGHIHNAIRTLFYRRKQIAGLHLTQEEYLQTLVPYESRDLFREVAPLISLDRMTYRFHLRTSQLHLPDSDLQVVMILNGDNRPPLPRTVLIQPDAPKEVVERISHWVEHGGDVSREFGRVHKVFDILNETQSRVAIRYYWPTLLALCSEGNVNTKMLVSELQDLRTPAKLKPLPLGLQRACRQTADTIATTRLIPHDAETPDYTEGVTINVVTGQVYDEEIGKFGGDT